MTPGTAAGGRHPPPGHKPCGVPATGPDGPDRPGRCGAGSDHDGSAAPVAAPRPSPDGGPFALLGLPASGGVTDQDVRAAWRRIAAATHPDRPDGGDPERFAAASAAYTALRTRSGRGEVLADLARPGGPVAISPPRKAPTARRAAAAPEALVARATAPGDRPPGHGPLTRAATRVRHGRPAVLTVRLLIVVTVGIGSAALVGSAPATPALITGAVTWLLLTARGDLAPPR